jgi:hypothetical protein
MILIDCYRALSMVQDPDAPDGFRQTEEEEATVRAARESGVENKKQTRAKRSMIHISRAWRFHSRAKLEAEGDKEWPADTC